MKVNVNLYTKSISTSQFHQLRSLKKTDFYRKPSIENKFPSARFLSERPSKHIPIMGIFGLVCSNLQSIGKLQPSNNWRS